MAFIVGDTVFLKVSQSYLKTNAPMPMLRPPDLVSFDELGQIVALLPMGMAAVKYRRGTFLLKTDHLSSEDIKKDSNDE